MPIPFMLKASVPDEVAQALQEHLPGIAHIIPPWCERVQIHYEGNGDNETLCATIKVSYQYRDADLTIYGHWLAHSPEVRGELLRHELAHILVAPLAYWVERVIRRFCDDDKHSSKVLREEMEEREEMVVQDVRAAIERAAKERDEASVHRRSDARV